MKVARAIPNGLPMTSPKNTPNDAADELAAEIVSESMITPIFARANSGTIAKLDQGCSLLLNSYL